jgi:Chaperone of endosialidase
MSSIFDIFSTQPAQDAAAAQTQGINAGRTAATGNINQGIGATTANYTAGMQPFLANYTQSQGGTNAYGNAVGANGPAGNDAAIAAFMNNPGYQFQKQEGDSAINAQAAATGMNASGNQALALSKYNQGLAGTSWNNYVSSLAPYFNQANTAAQGIGNMSAGLGNSLANQYGNLGNLNYASATGIGNANANADLSAYNASGNFWNMLGGIGGAKTSGGGSIGGNLLGSFGGVPGAVGPTSVGGAPLSSGILGGLSSLAGSIFSDSRLKEDIESVGELYDGQEVYKYRYIGSPVWQIGLMAQDVEKIIPDAVTEVGGYKALNLNKATQYASELARFLEAA